MKLSISSYQPGKSLYSDFLRLAYRKGKQFHWGKTLELFELFDFLITITIVTFWKPKYM